VNLWDIYQYLRTMSGLRVLLSKNNIELGDSSDPLEILVGNFIKEYGKQTGKEVGKSEAELREVKFDIVFPFCEYLLRNA